MPVVVQVEQTNIEATRVSVALVVLEEEAGSRHRGGGGGGVAWVVVVVVNSRQGTRMARVTTIA